MCLLDRVTEYSEQSIECATDTHRDQNNPLRRAGQLSALHLAEYAAQAMAAHGALMAGGDAQSGMLAALRDIKLYAERIDTIDTELIVRATRRLAQRDGSLYDFNVYSEGQLLCEGRIAIAFT
jgi:predicted hotdog family 3-hydroxylacyl-ACP dehydratase